MCGCVLFIEPWHQNDTFPSFFEIDKTAGAYSLQISDYLSQIQRETKAFLQIVWHVHNTEGALKSDWHWRHRTIFFFVGSQNRVNLVLLLLLLLLFFLSCLISLDSCKPIQKRISVNHEGLSTPITT